MIIKSLEITSISNWADKLAELTRIAWLGQGGKCYFPYQPLTEAITWDSEILTAWADETMFSWVLVDQKENILAHVALVAKNGHFELGRWVARSDAPKGSVTSLCWLALQFANDNGWLVCVEATQAHTASQHICLALGLRFAGIGILAELDGVVWDIIFFDNVPTQPFVPKSNVLGDPLGKELSVETTHLSRLRQISEIITTERGGPLPPQKFHIHPALLALVQEILMLNLVGTV